MADEESTEGIKDKEANIRGKSNSPYCRQKCKFMFPSEQFDEVDMPDSENKLFCVPPCPYQYGFIQE